LITEKPQMGVCSVNMYVCMYVTNFKVTEISSKILVNEWKQWFWLFVGGWGGVIANGRELILYFYAWEDLLEGVGGLNRGNTVHTVSTIGIDEPSAKLIPCTRDSINWMLCNANMICNWSSYFEHKSSFFS